MTARPKPRGRRAYAGLKRALDLSIAIPLLCAAAPVLSVLALAIQRRSPGPVWFRQRRIGRDQRPFAVFKLRTMHADAEQRLARMLAEQPALRARWEQHAWMQDDPRVAGRAAMFARRYGLDELPQLWNVVRGEMSMVGPRPVEPAVVEALFSPAERRARHCVPPGLTGLWQVRRASPSVESLRRFDLVYLRHRSLRLDLWILAQTPSALLSGRVS